MYANEIRDALREVAAVTSETRIAVERLSVIVADIQEWRKRQEDTRERRAEQGANRRWLRDENAPEATRGTINLWLVAAGIFVAGLCSFAQIAALLIGHVALK